MALFLEPFAVLWFDYLFKQSNIPSAVHRRDTAQNSMADLGGPVLTSEMTKAWSGKTVREYKELKGLKKESLRDNMTDIGLALTMLAEVTTTAISKREQPTSFDESKKIAKRGGSVAKDARRRVEKQIGESVISPLNASNVEQLTTKKDD